MKGQTWKRVLKNPTAAGKRHRRAAGREALHARTAGARAGAISRWAVPLGRVALAHARSHLLINAQGLGWAGE